MTSTDRTAPDIFLLPLPDDVRRRLAVGWRVPMDRLLVETDAPYLAPVPHRGKINQPAYVRHVAEEIARLRGVDLETVATATSANYTNLFKH